MREEFWVSRKGIDIHHIVTFSWLPSCSINKLWIKFTRFSV